MINEKLNQLLSDYAVEAHKTHNNARLSSHFYSLCQILLKVLTRILCAVLVVHVIASKLDSMKPKSFK